MTHLTLPRNSCSWGIGLADSFRQQSKKCSNGTGCVLPDTLILTRQGWIKISDLVDYTDIAQWDKLTGKIQFLPAKLYVTDFDGQLIQSKSTTHNITYTPQHTIPTIIRNKYVDIKANYLYRIKEHKIPNGGAYLSNNTYNTSITTAMLRLIVAVQADGSFDSPTYIRLAFKKKRKIQRLLDLAAINNLNSFKEISASPGYRRFIICGYEANYIYNFLQDSTKTFSYDNLFKLNYEQLNAFLDELKYWDAHIRGRSFWYFTTNKTNAYIVATIAHLCNKSATVNIKYDNDDGYGNGNNKILYTVNIKPRNYLLTAKQHFKLIPYTGKVYCAITETGYFLVKKKRTIVITGNTNLQNPTKAICKIYEPDDGKIFVQADQAGAEALIVAYLCRPGAFRNLFLNGIKPHVFVALHNFRKQFEDVLGHNLQEFIELDAAGLRAHKNFKSVEDVIKDSDNWIPSERYYFIAKMLCHASNYGMEARAFQMHVLKKSEGKVALSLGDCELSLSKYHGLFPEIREWHKEIDTILGMTRTLRNLFGFPRVFYDIPIDREVKKKAYAWIPQSTVGVITHYAFVGMQQYIEDNKLDWDMLNNKHDSILVQCPLADEAQCKIKTKSSLEIDLISPRGEKFKMKSEVVSGFNWSPYHKTKNPNGLK